MVCIISSEAFGNPALDLTIDDAFPDFEGNNASFLTFNTLGTLSVTVTDPEGGMFTSNVAVPDYTDFADQVYMTLTSTFEVDDLNKYSSINFDHREYLDAQNVYISVNGNVVVNFGAGNTTHTTYETDPLATQTITGIDKSFFVTGTNTLTIYIEEVGAPVGIAGFAGFGRFVGIVDTDLDGISNCFDLDSDGDGCSDAYEAGATTDQTANFQFSDVNGDPDGLSPTVDAGGDGTTDYPSTYNSNAINNAVSTCLLTCSDPDLYANNCDFDGDGVNNIDDLDDDNDGVLDSEECPVGAFTNIPLGFLDASGNGTTTIDGVTITFTTLDGGYTSAFGNYNLSTYGVANDPTERRLSITFSEPVNLRLDGEFLQANSEVWTFDQAITYTNLHPFHDVVGNNLIVITGGPNGGGGTALPSTLGFDQITSLIAGYSFNGPNGNSHNGSLNNFQLAKIPTCDTDNDLSLIHI